jgi:hypothetical protein
MTRKLIEQAIEDAGASDDSIKLADGFEDAFLGVARQFASQGHVAFAVYDRNKCVQILVDRDGMSETEAEEFFSFNVEGAFVGDPMPAFLQR